MDQSQSHSCMTSAVIKASCLLHLFEKSTEDGLMKFASVVFNIELDRLYLQRTISHQRPWLILQGNTSIDAGKSKKSLCRRANDARQDIFYCAFAYFRCLRKHNRVRGNEIKHLASELTIRTTVPKHFNTKYPRGIFLIV